MKRFRNFQNLSFLRLVAVWVITLCVSVYSDAADFEENEKFDMEQQQSKTVSGTIVGEDGEPLIGVSVFEKGLKSNVTITDINGAFTLTLKNGNLLELSYVGYKSQTISVQNSTTLNIVLEEDVVGLEELVVVAYGSSKKRDLTGSVSSLSENQLKIQQVSTASRALEGMIPGVQFSNKSGQPGADSKIQIRGLGSITGSTDPLVVVDGVATSFGMSSINPNDIESIVVSKDAAANALYGSRAAHGLILITTKRGKSGKPRINLDVRFGSTSRGVPDYDKVTDPAAFYEYTWRGIYNYAKYFPDRDDRFKNMSDQEMRQYASDNLFKANGNTLSDRNGLGNYMLYRIPDGTTLIDPATGKVRQDAQLLYHDNWEDYFLQNSFRQEYNANVSGGTDKTDYFFSLGYLSDPSYVMGSDFNRYSARMKVNSQLTPWLKSGMNMSYARTYTNAPNYTGGTVNTNVFTWMGYFGPLNALFAHDRDGNIMKGADGKPLFDLGTGQTYSPYGTTARMAFNGYSPGIYFEKDLTETTKDFFNGYAYMETTFLNDFTVKVDISVDNEFIFRKDYQNNESGSGARDYNGTILNAWTKNTTINLNQLLTWNAEFDVHHINVLAGHEYRWWRVDYTSGEKSDMFALNKPDMSNAIKINSLTGYGNHYALEGYLGRMDYNYNYKYYLSASLRTDGSSYFRENKWGTFWSVGGAYRISEEAFLKENIKWLDETKFRVSYGTLGNNNVAAWSWTDTWGVSNAGSLDNQQLSLSQTGFGNELLTWEKLYSFGVGLDFRIFNRILGTVDYYSRTTKDMLWNVPVAASTGMSAAAYNTGEMQNRGIEVDLSADVVRRKNLTWNVGINASHGKNKLTKVPEGVGSQLYDGGYVTGNFLRGEGKDYYNLYMYRYAGVDQETGLGMLYKELKETDDLSQYPGKAVGDLVTTTVGSEATRFELGSASPDLVGGFNTSVRFKDFDFAMATSWQLGGKIVDLSYMGLTGNAIGRAFHKDLLDAWTPENTSSNIPMRMLGGTNYGSQPVGGGAGQYSDFALFDASYFNVKSVTLGYTIPKSILSKISFEGLRIYVSAENLFLISAKRGLDPRTSIEGGSEVGAFGFPQSKVISIGLNINI